MKILIRFWISIFILLTIPALTLSATGNFQYVSPKPNSFSVSTKTNIILRNGIVIDRLSIDADLIRVVGSKSGIHPGDLLLSDDNKTMVFNPDTPFASDEVVNVSLQKGIKTSAGAELAEFSFGFTTAKGGAVQSYANFMDDGISALDIQLLKMYDVNKTTALLPAPPITIDSVNNPSPGYIFMATWDRNVPAKYGNFIFVLDSAGAIIDSVRVNGAPYDFQIQPNGLLSYALGDYSSNVPLPGEELQHIVRDDNLAVVDSFKMKNGYLTDFHEFKMLPNGHVMMMSYHSIIYDMSTVVEGGKPDAELVINIIQEQDRARNVVFEWRNLDYIPITDSDEDLTAPRINYSTLNAFDVDNDGNILASFRNHSEIMKINRETGELMWRMGGPRGEFTYVGEHEANAPYYHARQHNIRRRPNGNITLFDNGQYHKPPYSRAVEYTLDEENKVATLVSEWRYPNGNIFCATAGNAEQLANGGWFIGYGVPNPQFVKRNAVEVHPDGSIALEFSLPPGILAYRAYKFPWKELVRKPTFTHMEVKVNNTYSFNNDSITTGIAIKYESLTAADYNESKITRLPYGPLNPQFIEDLPIVYPVSFVYEGLAITAQKAILHVDLSAYPEIKKPGKTMVYHRQFPNQGLFIPLATTYDSSANELRAETNGFGEFVFGETDLVYTAQAPIPYEPENDKKVLAQDSLALRWSGKGFYDQFQVQVSADSTFGTILADSTLNLSYLWLDNLTDTTNYWRIRSFLGEGTSDWSEVWRFEPTDAFVMIKSPNGGEAWARGDTVIIRWETNISDSVSLVLLRGDQNVLSIGQSLGSISAFEWQIATELASDTSYKIQIMSLKDAAITDTSDAVFSLTDPTGIEAVGQKIPERFSLSQNYPNPFNPGTRIKFTLPKAEMVSIEVYNTLGQMVGRLLNQPLPAGIHEVGFNGEYLPSGIYFYRIEAGAFHAVKKMILIR